MLDTSPETLYLKKIHDLTLQNEVDIHTYFYLKNMEVCPICNQWLVMRGIPTLATKGNGKS